MTKLIEVKHSTYGIVKLSMEKSDYGSILFLRNDGSLCGEMDRDGGGMLAHPSKEVDKFLRGSLDTTLLDIDENGYTELEDLLYEAADEAYPGYFNP
jgi:hypothetical protein